MLTHPTIDQLRQLGLYGMATAFQELDAQSEARSLEHGEWLAILLEREATMRQQKRFEARARAAKLRHDAQIENADFRAARGLDRNLVHDPGRLRLDQKAPQPSHHRTGRGWQKLVGVRDRPQSLPRGFLCRVSSRPEVVCPPRNGKR